MMQRDLLKQPVWQGDELGQPLPETVHAISAAMPRWSDVIGYEEKNPEIVEKLKIGYPRFLINPLVTELVAKMGNGRPCLPFPSIRVAERAAHYIEHTTGVPAGLVQSNGVHGVMTELAGARALKDFWQHTGLIVSSRQAESALKGLPDIEEAHRFRSDLRRQLAGFYQCEADDVFLAPTGMASQFEALSAVMKFHPGLKTIQMGFPYVDTLKLQQKVGVGVHLLHDLEHIESGLEKILGSEKVAAAFCEIPGNPLLGSVDVRRITPLLRKAGVPLIVDDVVATPLNVDFRSHADLIATSLTKYISGTCDVMGGALICNPSSPFHKELKAIIKGQHEELLWGMDAAVIDRQANSFPERMERHNANGLYIAEKLRVHPKVEKVWYPKWEFSEAYEAVRKPSGGWGSLITFIPRNAASASPRVYDAMEVCKGPSLGSVFTLACPFTLLAHYTELEWAEACGVSRYLIRISVGLEEPKELWARIETALNAA